VAGCLVVSGCRSLLFEHGRLAERNQRLRGHLLVLNIKGNTLMITRESVETVLGRIRPFMQADGGGIELVVVDGNSATVQLTGMCAVCPSGQITLFLGVEAALRESLPEFEILRVV
jgi:Fe-S cluster biogenesis protein NfuA